MAYSLEGLPNNIFPHPLLSDEDGLLGISRHLDLDRVLTGYHFGIFPWYSEPYPVHWYYTRPRLVLFLDEFKVSKSMRNILNRDTMQVQFNRDFRAVIEQCANIERNGQEDTWIGEDIKRVYNHLHKMRYAQSVEAYVEDDLVGGLYGIALGRIFFGESMFAHQKNASKICLIKLVNVLKEKGFLLIDCQQETPHLISLGARLISGETFWQLIKTNLLDILSLKQEFL